MGAGRLLTEKEAAAPESLRTAIACALADETLPRERLARMREDFLSCPGPKGAADFIEEIGRKGKKRRPAGGGVLQKNSVPAA